MIIKGKVLCICDNVGSEVKLVVLFTCSPGLSYRSRPVVRM